MAHVSSSAQNMQSQTTAASMPITSTTNIISSTNMNTNNLSSNSSNISGLVQLHPTAVFVASSGGRNSNTKVYNINLWVNVLFDFVLMEHLMFCSFWHK